MSCRAPGFHLSLIQQHMLSPIRLIRVEAPKQLPRFVFTYLFFPTPTARSTLEGGPSNETETVISVRAPSRPIKRDILHFALFFSVGEQMFLSLFIMHSVFGLFVHTLLFF